MTTTDVLNQANQKFWWLCDKEKRAQTLTDTFKLVKQGQELRRSALQRYCGYYVNGEFSDFAPGAYAQMSGGDVSRFTWNLVRSCVDTMWAKLAADKIKPQVLTDDGDYELATRAQNLDRALLGQFSLLKVYEKAGMAERDGLLLGDGELEVTVDHEDEKIEVERVFTSDIYYDTLDAVDGSPRLRYREKWVPLTWAQAKYPEHAEKFETIAHKENSAEGLDKQTLMVPFVQAWHLKSSSKAKDGRTTCACGDVLLWDRPYDADHFPAARFRWCPPLRGPYSQGLGQQLEGHQLQLQKLLQRIAACQHLMSVPRIFVSNAANIPDAMFTNNEGGIIRGELVEGRPPEPLMFPAMHPEVYQWVQTIWQRGFEDAGISIMSATAKKPGGLESAVAMREFQDIASERFAHVGEEHKRFFIQIAELLIECNRELAKLKKNYVLPLDGENTYRRIEWNKVDMERDAYVMRVYPTSFLPQTVAAKKQTALELMQYGAMSLSDITEMVDFPDLQRLTKNRVASKKAVESDLNAIILDDADVVPEGWMDLAYAKTHGTDLLARFRTQKNFPEETKTRLLRYIARASELQRLATAAQPPAPAMAPDGSMVAPPDAMMAPAPGAMPPAPAPPMAAP